MSRTTVLISSIYRRSMSDFLKSRSANVVNFSCPPDTLRRQVVSLARRQVGGSVAHPPHDAVGQQAGQGAVNRRVRLPQDERQFRRVAERRPAEGVEQLLVWQSHMFSVAREGWRGHPSDSSVWDAQSESLAPVTAGRTPGLPPPSWASATCRPPSPRRSGAPGPSGRYGPTGVKSTIVARSATRAASIRAPAGPCRRRSGSAPTPGRTCRLRGFCTLPTTPPTPGTSSPNPASATGWRRGRGRGTGKRKTGVVYYSNDIHSIKGLAMNMPNELTVPQAASYLNVSEETVRRNIRSKRLTALRRGTQWFIQQNVLAIFANSYDPKTGKIRRML